MTNVSLYDRSHDRSIKLSSSSTITVGRGFFECNDKRVSRKHAEITVLEAKIKIKACHTNPIFYKVNGAIESQILTKDCEIELRNLDKFSLLPDSECEYEIKILQEENNLVEETPVTISSSISMRIRNANEINENLEAGNMAMSLSQIMGNNTIDDNNRVDEDLERTPSPDMLIPPPDYQPASQSGRSRKRSHENVEGDGDSPKRAKSSENSAVADTTTSAQPTTSNEPSNPQAVTIKPDPDAEPSSASAIVQSSENAASSNLLKVIKPDPDGVSTSSNPAVSSSTSANTKNAKSVATGPPDSTTAGTAVKTEDKLTSSNQNPLAQPAPPNLRQSCEHGIRCYRNTPEHRRDLAHPNDADYRRPSYPSAPATVPSCPFGTSCYRRNPDHFRSLQHPSSSVYTTRQPYQPAPAANINAGESDDDENASDDSDADRDFIAGDESPDDDDEGEENNLEE